MLAKNNHTDISFLSFFLFFFSPPDLPEDSWPHGHFVSDVEGGGRREEGAIFKESRAKFCLEQGAYVCQSERV